MNSLGLSVELSKVIYAPGDLVEGCINFNLAQKLPCEYITARLIGVLRTKFTLGDSDAFFPLSPNNQPRIFYRNEKVLIDREYEVYRTNKVESRRNSLESLQLEAFCANLPFPNIDTQEIQGIDIGKLQFPIRFFLPELGLVTSFSNPSSPTIVKYSIFVNMYTAEEKMTSLHEHVFSIVCPESISQERNQKSIIVEKNVDFEKARDIFVSLTLPKNEFLPTDPFLCGIQITNNWKHALKYLHFNIVQRIVSSGHLENFKDIREEKVKEIEFNGVGFPETMSKIEAGSNISFSPPPYYIPALVPNITASDLFSVEYYAQLRVGRSKSGILCTIRIPIKIGTHHEDEFKKLTQENGACSREELSRSFHESPCNTGNSFYGVDLLA